MPPGHGAGNPGHLEGPLDALQQYQVRGQVQGLTLAGAAPKEANRTLGLRNANAEFDLNQAGGKAPGHRGRCPGAARRV